MRSDVQLQQGVIREFNRDPRMDHPRITVRVEDSAVQLTGTVGAHSEKVAAREAAHRVAGVLDVAHDIKAQVPGRMERTDINSAPAVRHALEWDARVPNQQLRSTVADG
jgi:hypothetical protein